MNFNPADLAATSEKPQQTNKKKGGRNGQQNQPNGEANTKPEEQKPANSGDQAGAEPARTVKVEIPIDHCVTGYAASHVDFHVTPRQAAAAKVLWCSLSKAGARFQGGSSSHPDGSLVGEQRSAHTAGIRWLLDRIADAIEEESGKSLTRDFGLSFR